MPPLPPPASAATGVYSNQNHVTYINFNIDNKHSSVDTFGNLPYTFLIGNKNATPDVFSVPWLNTMSPPQLQWGGDIKDEQMKMNTMTNR